MYHIGIIDDVQNERDDIQVSILDNISSDETVDFKEYEIERKTKEELFKEIRNDIIEDNLNALIVDFRLDTTADIIKGWEIIEFMHEEIPEFPVVIMTNAPDESKESNSTDADKVYAKKTFLNPELNETKELVKNIMLNMRKYVKNRHELEAKLDIELNKMNSSEEDDDVIGNIVCLENELSKYKQIYQSSIEKNFDLNNLREAAEILEKYGKLVEE